ncbi:hypothetical protein Tco_1362901 [Tanacetum coccineum]
MKRGFRGVPRPLLPAMLSIVDPSAGQEAPSVTQPQPSSSVVPPTPPTTQPIPSEATTIPTSYLTCTNLPLLLKLPLHPPHLYLHLIDDLEKQLKETKQTFGKSVNKGKRYKRRKSSKEFASTGLDFEEFKSAFEKINTGGVKVSSGIEEINAGSLDVNTGIDPITTDSIRVSVPSLDREEAGLAEGIRLDALEKALEKEEVAKQVHLDSLIAQRMAEEQELTEEQKKRKAQESVLGKDLAVEDYAKRMVELVNQRRKHFAEERARSKRNKPMTQTQLRNYMSNFLKNQGTWKLTQLKKLNFEEVKAEFEKLVKQLDTYIPMNLEATKESLKRFGEELQNKTAKKLKFNDEGTQPTKEKIEEDKDDKLTKKIGKRRKQIARKGFHTDHDRDESEDSDEANEKDDYTSGTKIPINHVPIATKSPIIANYKIIKQERKGVYQIVRENGTYMVYISFGAMLADISRDDLTKLYRIVMKKHGMNEPEDEFEKSADVYMLIERKYHLSAEVCKAMLDKKLQGGKPDEDCYKLLKMMEKQAGAKGLTSPEQTATVEMVFSRPWTCTFLVAKGLTTPELMANWLHSISFYREAIFCDIIDIRSTQGVVRPEHEGLPWMLDDPYVQVALQAPPSPDYIPVPKELKSPPLPDFVLEPVYPEYMPQEDEVFPAEEQLLPAAASPTA